MYVLVDTYWTFPLWNDDPVLFRLLLLLKCHTSALEKYLSCFFIYFAFVFKLQGDLYEMCIFVDKDLSLGYLCFYFSTSQLCANTWGFVSFTFIYFIWYFCVFITYVKSSLKIYLHAASQHSILFFWISINYMLNFSQNIHVI